uniref:Uncharacterized protein n=1 Tax=Kalanchoe fedtschenkoi TaxID=63787 RepID=A0A7N0U3E4_KALFE
MGIQEQCGGLDVIANFMNLSFAGPSMRNLASRATFNIAKYTIWKERNKRIFKGEMASLDKLKKETVWELDIALSKIKRMKKTQKSMEWAASKGIVPEVFQKKKTNGLESLSE